MSSSIPEHALFSTIRSRLSTALLGDVLDTLGYENQFLPPNLRPLDLASKIIGRAMPVLEAEYNSFGQTSTATVSTDDSDYGPLRKSSFGLMMQALDSLRADEVYIASATSTGPPLPFAFWGGLMSTRAGYLKSAGAIVNGYVRDVDEIAKLGFPVWSAGLYARDQGPRGKVIDYRCVIQIGSVTIHPGDLVVADKEGVLIIPREVEEECVRLAVEKAEKENAFAQAVKGGMSVVEAFNEFGVM